MSQNVLLDNMTNVYETYIEAVFLQLSSGVSTFHLCCVSKQTIVIFSFKDWISPHQKEKLPNMWRAHIGPHTFSVSPPSLLFFNKEADKFAFFNKEAAKWSASVFRTLRWRQGKQENKWALWEVKITNLWKIRKGVFSQIWGRATLLTKKGRKTRTFRLFVNFLSIFSCRRQH